MTRYEVSDTYLPTWRRNLTQRMGETRNLAKSLRTQPSRLPWAGQTVTLMGIVHMVRNDTGKEHCHA
jgi:hypothetical protein